MEACEQEYQAGFRDGYEEGTKNYSRTVETLKDIINRMSEKTKQLTAERDESRREWKAEAESVTLLLKDVTKLKAERDAAVADLETIAKHSDQPCDWCDNHFNVDPTLCMMCDDEEHNGNFEWRGVQEEKHG